MAEVYLASLQGAIGFDRDVVIKKIHPRWLDNPDVLSLFRDEARLGSRLRHPNIVQVLDYGRSGASTFLVMEWVEGYNAADVIVAAEDALDPLAPTAAASIASEVCAALDHIHRCTDDFGTNLGIVHRDLNPANILLSFAGEVKVTDFGVAAGQHRELKTEHGILRGTFPYMSPEQTRCRPLDGRSDLFSLGICLYELLTGDVPFTGDFRTVLSKHMVQKPPSLSDALGEKVDEALEALVAKALEKDPAKRQPTMAAFLFEVKTLMDMLGFGRRRRGKKKSSSGKDPEDAKNRLARKVFDQCSIAFAVISASGDILLSNPVFSNFMKIDKKEQKSSILDPRFVRVHPEIPLDISRVVKTGTSIRRGLALHKDTGEQVLLMLHLAPMEGEKDRLLLTLVPA